MNIKWLVSAIMMIVMSACSRPYYGYTKGEWETMSDKDRSTAKAEFQPALDVKNSQQHKDLIESHRQKTITIGVEAQR